MREKERTLADEGMSIRKQITVVTNEIERLKTPQSPPPPPPPHRKARAHETSANGSSSEGENGREKRANQADKSSPSQGVTPRALPAQVHVARQVQQLVHARGRILALPCSVAIDIRAPILIMPGSRLLGKNGSLARPYCPIPINIEARGNKY